MGCAMDVLMTKIQRLVLSTSAMCFQHWMYFGVVFCILLASASYAQAQHPDVHQEPYHVPVYEWDCFRFLLVKARPGDTTGYHIHRNPILYITVEGAHVWLDDKGAAPRITQLADGWVGSNTYSDADTLLHRFAVVGGSALHILAVERIGECSYMEPPTGMPFYSRDGFSLYAVDWHTYISRTYYSKYPVIVPPKPIKTSGASATYGAGHLIKPYQGERGYGPMEGVEVVWVLIPTNEAR